MKFGRKYRLTIQASEGGEDIIIESPFTMKFNVQRSSFASINSASIQVNNLSLETRNLIFKDRFNYDVYRQVTLEAGYDELATIFRGNLYVANSERSGADIITNIVARDGMHDILNTNTYKTYAAGTTVKDVVEDLIGAFPNLTKGEIGVIDGDFKRGVVVNGNTFDALGTYTNNQVFVDNELVYALNGDEVVQADLLVLNAETGLLSTPRRDDAFVQIDTLFEPRITIGQLIEIQSGIEPVYDGQYKVIGVQHQGVISEAIGGNCTSTFNLLLEGQLYGTFKPVGTITAQSRNQ
jgi:hypothetical protein